MNESDLQQAREELGEMIVAGKTVAGINILACLDAECDHDTIAFLGDLDTLFRSLRYKGTLEHHADLYLTHLAMKHLSEDAVRERAEENERLRREDADAEPMDEYNRDEEEELAQQNQPRE